MDIDEKLKQEQLEYYKRENELREEAIKKREEQEETARGLIKAIFLIILILILMAIAMPFIALLIELLKNLLKAIIFRN